MDSNINTEKDDLRKQSAQEHITFLNAMIKHEEPLCPNCGKGRVVCPQGKIEKPHFFECTNKCGWFANIDYDDIEID